LVSNNVISLRHHQAMSAWRDGHRCLALADEAGALEAFQAAEDFDPELWQASLDLGRLLQSRGAGEAALSILAKVVVRTDAPEAHLAFAAACHEAGDHLSASAHFRAASGMLGDCEAVLYYDWAHTALAMDDFSQAQSCLKRFLRLRPGDVRASQLLDSLPRLQEFVAGDRKGVKAQAYIQHGTVLLGSASDDGLDLVQQPTAMLSHADLAVIAKRFAGLAAALDWHFDGYVCGSRSIRPWVQALHRLTGHPVVSRDDCRPGQRLIQVELNWGEAASLRLADLRAETGHGWSLALGSKFGANPAHISAVTAMVSVPWYRMGALSRDLPASRLFLDPDLNANVPAILRQCHRVSDEPGADHTAWYGRHRRFTAATLRPGA
jgi:tetratricopeptide (TPR) repeat protein